MPAKAEVKMEEKVEESMENTGDAQIQEEPTKSAEKVKEGLKKEVEERPGIAYVYSSYNNTIVHITDVAGNTISRCTGGMVTKHSRLKANPTTAMFVAKRAAEMAKDAGINSLYIRLKAKTGAPGAGPGGRAAVKTLGKEGFRILSVVEATKVPRGGPKKKGGKRGRRV